MNFSDLFRKTLPFIFLRVLAATGMVLLAVIYCAIAVSITLSLSGMLGNDSIVPTVAALILAIFAYGLWRFLRSVVLYAVKAGHVAVLSELITKGQLPDGVGQVSYGTGFVKEFFVTSSVLWALDLTINKAMRDARSAISNFANKLSFIPGAKFILAFFGLFISVLLNYADESVLGYIFLKGKSNPKKAAVDGIVLYVQNWKEMMKSAAIIALVLAASLGGAYALVYSLLIGSEFLSANTVVVFIIALLVFVFIKWAMIDPAVMIYMLSKYLRVALNQQPSPDMYSKLTSASKSFNKLVAETSGQALDNMNLNIPSSTNQALVQDQTVVPTIADSVAQEQINNNEGVK